MDLPLPPTLYYLVVLVPLTQRWTSAAAFLYCPYPARRLYGTIAPAGQLLVADTMTPSSYAHLRSRSRTPAHCPTPRRTHHRDLTPRPHLHLSWTFYKPPIGFAPYFSPLFSVSRTQWTVLVLPPLPAAAVLADADGACATHQRTAPPAAPRAAACTLDLGLAFIHACLHNAFPMRTISCCTATYTRRRLVSLRRYTRARCRGLLVLSACNARARAWFCSYPTRCS